eukprot:364196-Chlamydomonas_euryale.AAC.6
MPCCPYRALPSLIVHAWDGNQWAYAFLCASGITHFTASGRLRDTQASAYCPIPEHPFPRLPHPGGL